MSARAIAVNLVAGFSGTGLKTAQEQLQGVGAGLDKMTSRLGKAALSFAAFKGGQILGQFGAQAITEARNLERNLAAVETVFGSLSGTINQFSKDAVDVGLSQAEAAKASVFLGSVLKQSGFSMSEVSDQTQRLVSLGADLALTYGYDVQEALLGMTALFRGEYDPIEKFGVAMKQSEINSELAARGFDKLQGSARRLAEQQIRLDFLYQRSADSQGAFERQSGTLAVEQERLQATMSNMLQTAGGPLLSVMADLAEAMVPVVHELTPILAEQFEKLVPTGEDLRIKIGEIADTFIKFVEILGTLTTAFVNVSSFVIQNIESIAVLVTSIFAIKGSIAVVTTLSAAFEVMDTKVKMTEASAKNLKLALMGTGIGLVVTGIGTAFAAMALEGDKAKEAVVNVVSTETRIEALAAKIALLTAEQRELNETTDGQELPFYTAELERVTEALEDARYQMGLLNNMSLWGIREEFRMTSVAAGHLADLTSNIAPFVMPPPEVDEEGTGEAAKDYVKIFTDGLADEMAKQRTKLQLISKGASEGLIDAILSTDGWMKVWQAIKSGELSLKALQSQFNRTASGAEELKKKAEAAVAPIDKMVAGLKDKAEMQAAVTELTKLGFAAEFVSEALSGEDWDKVYEGLINSTKYTVDEINNLWKQANPDPLKEVFDLSALVTQLGEDSRKEVARQVLISKGASADLAEAIIGSGDDWETLYKQIINGATNTIAELQAIFNTTSAGLAEIQRQREQAQQEYDKAFKEFLDKIEDANDALMDIYEEEVRAHEKAMTAYERHIDLVGDFRKQMEELTQIDIFNTYERAIGRFEGQSVKSFENIRKATEQAFEKGLITEAYRNELFAYARTHETLLNDIQRQRDELASKRSLVEALMDDVKSATASAGDITNLFAAINDTADKIDVAKVIQDTVSSGKNLKDFRVTLITNLANPLSEVAGKAKQLTSNFQSVVDRTKLFLENLRTLRKLGLDPMLFNQLVQAGAEAGGETAQALIDGGSETITEVNKLFGELNSLGAELAEETAQVMYGTGIEFTDSLIDGIQSKQDALEAQARAMADAFVKAFVPVLNAGITIAMPKMPVAPTTPTLFTEDNPPPGVTAPVMPDILKDLPSQVTTAVAPVVPVVKDLSASIQKVQELINNATRFIRNTTDAVQKAGAETKLNIFEQIMTRLRAGEDVNLTGVEAGLSSTELQTRTGITPTNVTFNINVNANTRPGGAAAGEAVVKAIQDYVQTNGSVSNIVAGIGQVAV
jgi:hypothetical protein